MRIVLPSFRVAAAIIATVASTAIGVSAQTATTLTPTVAKTIALSRCGGSGLSTTAANCQGFDATDIRGSTEIFVIGFENNQEMDEKHVMQVAMTFDLSQVLMDDNSEVSHAALTYSEASTTHRSASGDSEYGILPTCNTRLGVPTSPWNGSVTSLVATRPALTAGVTPASTAELGSWDVTPQVREWLAAGQNQGTLVMQADDESPNIQGQLLCLSYVFDMALNVETAPKQ